MTENLLPHLVNYSVFIEWLNSILQSNYEQVKDEQDFFTVFETVSWYTGNIEASIMLLISLGSSKVFEIVSQS